jgi:predicted RNase H-like HicB family nuclease
VKVRHAIRLIEEDGWRLVRTRREAVGGLDPWDGGQHPSTGRAQVMTDFADQAERYLILVEGGPPANYSAWAPDLPGCVATGDDIDECAQNMRDAIAFHLEGLESAGERAPDPSSGAGVYVAHAA